MIKLKRINFLIGLNGSGKTKFANEIWVHTYINPENGLHPVKQAEWIEDIVKGGKQCIIETHSGVMINRIGHMIAYGDESLVDEVSVLYFKEGEVKELSFDKKGQIIDFPLGFFCPNKLKL